MSDRFKFRFFNKLSNEYENTYDLQSCEVLDYVIPEQCTGLKDKNGKLIYEGDILGGVYGAPIKWCDKEKSFELFFEDDCMSCGGDVLWSDVVEDDGKLEVIGNIHEVQDDKD